MTEYDDLVRALLVERYRRWPPPDEPDTGTGQLAAALAHEKRRPAALRRRAPTPRGFTQDTDRRRPT